MTYCLGILLPCGLTMASDSRSNAGIDNITTVKKTAFFEVPGERVIAVLSAGNLATTQSVVSKLRQAQGTGKIGWDLMASNTMFDAAQVVGATLRETINYDRDHVSRYGSADGTFLVGGQIKGEPPRLFQIYSAGNFVEATPRNPFLQNGEAKYGKPILDRALDPTLPLPQIAKLALLSFDATIRSNLSVSPPIDLWSYQPDSFNSGSARKFSDGDPYWTSLSKAYSDGLASLVTSLPEMP